MNKSATMSAKETLYVVASRPDDASEVALGKSKSFNNSMNGNNPSTTNGIPVEHDDAETLDMAPMPEGSRKPGGRSSIPDADDWSEETTTTSNGHSTTTNGTSVSTSTNAATTLALSKSPYLEPLPNIGTGGGGGRSRGESAIDKPGSTTSTMPNVHVTNGVNGTGSVTPGSTPTIASALAISMPPLAPLAEPETPPPPPPPRSAAPSTSVAPPPPNQNATFPIAASSSPQQLALPPSSSSSSIQQQAFLHPSPSISLQCGHFSMQGIRPEMEDRVTLLPHPELNNLGQLSAGAPPAAAASSSSSSSSSAAAAPSNISHTMHGSLFCMKERSFFAVFDGHGGDVSAEYARQHVHNNLLMSEAFLAGRPLEGLKQALVKTEADFCAACRRINLLSSSGTTAITALFEGLSLYVGNIGDSRAVLCRGGRAVDASIDHKPGRKEERARIEALGGRVGITEEDAFRPTPRPCPCLWSCVTAGRPLRVFPGGLSVSRTIGDISMKSSQLVSSEPEMFETKLTSQDEFLILACDGVWDVMSSSQAVDYVRTQIFRHQNASTENNTNSTSQSGSETSNNLVENVAKSLANEAFRKGSTDNISVVLVCISVKEPSSSSSSAPNGQKH